MITADTITNEQLRSLAEDNDTHVRVQAKLALGEAVTHKPDGFMRRARERCAEILNARNGRHVASASAPVVWSTTILGARVRVGYMFYGHSGVAKPELRERTGVIVAIGNAYASWEPTIFVRADDGILHTYRMTACFVTMIDDAANKPAEERVDKP